MEIPNLKGCRLLASCRGNEANGPEATTLDKEVDAVTNATTVQSQQEGGWASIDWTAATRVVQRLQQRIFRASQQGRWRQVRSLQKLLLRSDANLVLSVRQVTQVNDGRATPGVDGRIATTAKERWRLLTDLRQARPHRPQPVRRVYIPKVTRYGPTEVQKLPPRKLPWGRGRPLRTAPIGSQCACYLPGGVTG